MPRGLEGRRALVTGGSRGLGREIALTLTRAGAHVAILARPSDTLDEALAALRTAGARPGQSAHKVAADLARPEAVQEAFHAAATALGGVDILVNNAGIIGPIDVLDQTDPVHWAETMQVNLIAPVALMRAALPAMRDRRWGRIVNISGGGATSPRPNFTAYAAAKTAIVRVTESTAHELAGTGVHVNAVAPGAMNTRLLDQVLAAGPEHVGPEYERALEQQRNGGSPPARAAALVAWLVSPESDGITGRLFSAVWDPWESLAAFRDELADSDVFTLRRIIPADRGKDWG